MTHRTLSLRLLALALAATAILVPYAADSGLCLDRSARNLLAASYLDAAINPSGGEDLEFLYREGGFPNIAVLFDSSMSMRLLPPDGPGKIGGPGSTKPPTGIVGCGLDAVSSTTSTWINSQTIQGVMARKFYPPCTAPLYYGLPYQGHATDYAQLMTVCPYFTSSNNQATGAPGYDPDFYNSAGPTDTTKNGAPVFFARDLVFHDAALSGTASFGSPKGDGWTDTAVYPWQVSNNKIGTIADFCKNQGTTLQGTRTHEDICNECMSKSGWYYDGTSLGSASDYAGVHPSLWYTGNYLSFFPPKFLAARKVIKDVIAVQSRIRMAMARFDGSGATFFQPFNPSCGMPDGSNFDSNRASYISSLNNSGTLPFDGSTPLAEALFDVGRYYHSPDLPWFGTSWENTSKESAGNANQAAICFSCQVSTVIVITDGQPNVNDGSGLPTKTATQAQADTLYAGDVNTGVKIGNPPCATCNDPAFTGTSDYLNNMARVAWYLNNFDLRKNTETTLDCKSQPGKQKLQTYTLGFATAQLPNAERVLKNTAAAGGGIFAGAEDPSQLKEKFNYILQEISTRSTSFSVATISTLQTTSGRAVIVPRFDPAKSNFWKGHLFRFDLYSEFVNDCVPFGAGDLDCDGVCQGTFLQDDSGTDAKISLISEDGNGSFVRNEPTNQPICAQAPLCGSACAVGGTAPAVPFWDAGQVLANRRWTARTVYTVTDSNNDYVIDGNDRVIQLQTNDNTAAEAIAPYLGLGKTALGQSVCVDIAGRLATAGDYATSAAVASDNVACAKTVIRYLLGADVFNEKGEVAPAWPPADPNLLWDRPWKLGDIFHSSPVVVDPPLPREGLLCTQGLHDQCLPSLWATPTPGGTEAYDGYSLSDKYYNRNKIILVGANDGLLHAFHGGAWRGNPTPGTHNASADDPYTSKVDESLPPFNGYFDRGTAEELWAFLPPDLLSKTPYLLGTSHQFFVDGSPMVRDVWVDGSVNGLDGSVNLDNAKQANEFHTVAVTGLRRGGTRYFALDVTDAATQGSQPRFLWIYPQPNDPEGLLFGETYDDYLPSPPPIGPVRVEPDAKHAANSNTLKVEVPTAADPVSYHERWITFLSGGFDPQYVRGRGVHMVDVWTGEEIFDFSYPKDPAAAPAGDPRLQMRFPVAAPVGMMGWGKNAYLSPSSIDNEGFFDSAAFGDLGGQLWMLRFFAPAKLGADGKATNWFGGRAFQMGLRGDCSLCGGQPFFTITGDYPLRDAGSSLDYVYRTFIGTGDRFNLLDKNGGTCGPDNIRACVMRGCTVTVDPASNYLQAPDLGSAKRGLSQAACGTISSTQTDDVMTTCTVDGSARIAVTACPNGAFTTKNIAASCTEQTGGYRCSTTTNAPGDKVSIPETYPINVGNWFFSFLMFEKDNDRDVFWDLAGAKRYDAARSTLSQTGKTTYAFSGPATPNPWVSFAATNNTPTTGANMFSRGWSVYYDHGPTVTVDYHQFTVAWQDERTTAGAAVLPDIMTWHATQPTQGEVISTSGSCRSSKCTAENRRISYHYAAHPVTGLPVFADSTGAVTRSVASYLLVPSQADQKTVFVNQEGLVAVGLTAVNPEKGATTVGMTEGMDPTADAGFLQIDEELHACRHADGVTTQPACK